MLRFASCVIKILLRHGTNIFSKTLWTNFVKIVIVCSIRVRFSFTTMTFDKLLILFSSIVFMAGCNCSNSGSQPSNPFASNLRTVPPPATFSSQDSYLGQTPGTYIPQTPATTYPAGSLASADSVLLSNATNGEKATLFAATEQDSGWTATETALTSQTAFQAMETKVNSSPVNSADGESLTVSTTPAVTTIKDDSQSTATGSSSVYSGGFTE